MHSDSPIMLSSIDLLWRSRLLSRVPALDRIILEDHYGNARGTHKQDEILGTFICWHKWINTCDIHTIYSLSCIRLSVCQFVYTFLLIFPPELTPNGQHLLLDGSTDWCWGRRKPKQTVLCMSYGTLSPGRCEGDLFPVCDLNNGRNTMRRCVLTWLSEYASYQS